MCRVCWGDKSSMVWCDPCWAVVKAKALVAPERVSKRTKVNKVLRPALGLESEGSVALDTVDYGTWGVLWFSFSMG